MRRMELHVRDLTIPVVAGHGASQALVRYLIERQPRPTRVLIVHDPAVEDVAAGIARQLPLPMALLRLPKGEQAKRLMTIEQLHAACAKLDPAPDRSSVVVAVGGGATGDVAGLFAATFMRGVSVIHVPTTLLSMVDSSVGGKTAVNTLLGKNTLGVFHQPEAVFADFDALETLPRREYRAAFAEIVKVAAMLDAEMFEMVEKDAVAFGVNPVAAAPSAASYVAEAVDRGDREAGGNLVVAAGCATLASMVEELVARCLMHKGRVVAADEREAGPRMVLNYGHTMGHALERASEYRMLHGEAVSIGMVLACFVGESMGVTPPVVSARILGVLRKLGLPVTPPPGTDPVSLAALAWGDKKRRAGELTFVACPEIGAYKMVQISDARVLADAVRRGLANA